jgi:hypothetical protein
MQSKLRIGVFVMFKCIGRQKIVSLGYELRMNKNDYKFDMKLYLYCL